MPESPSLIVFTSSSCSVFPQVAHGLAPLPALLQRSPTFLAPWNAIFPWTRAEVGRDGLGRIKVHYVNCALYFRYYYVNSTSDHQALDPGGWGPLIYRNSVA